MDKGLQRAGIGSFGAMIIGLLLSVVALGCGEAQPDWTREGSCKPYINAKDAMGCDFMQRESPGLKIAARTFVVHSNFLLANLAGAEMSDLFLYFDDFERADLTGANLQNTMFYLSGLRGTIFESANLRGADVWRVDASGANFSQANLEEAHFHETHLFAASFVGASLRGASFIQVSLNYADFTDADLTGAFFGGLYNLDGVYEGPTYCRTTMPDGRVNDEGC